jgi:hypothetical protein
MNMVKISGSFYAHAWMKMCVTRCASVRAPLKVPTSPAKGNTHLWHNIINSIEQKGTKKYGIFGALGLAHHLSCFRLAVTWKFYRSPPPIEHVVLWWMPVLTLK